MSRKFATFTFAVLLTLCSWVPATRANITISFTGGDFFRQDKTTYMPTNGLLELIADTTGNGFSAPTANAFLPAGSGDVIVASFSLTGTYDGAGTTQNLLKYDPTNATLYPGLAQGDALELRWFPTLTTASTAPGAGTEYGEFRTNVSQDGSNLSPAWTEPANNVTRNLNFLTTGEMGSNADSLGAASLTVPAPEPSTMLFGGILTAYVGIHCFVRRRMQASV